MGPDTHRDALLDRLEQSGFEPSQVLVAGDGLWAIWGLRTTHDVTLLVPDGLHAGLADDDAWDVDGHVVRRGHVACLSRWGRLRYGDLAGLAERHHGWWFVDRGHICARKAVRGGADDLHDLNLLASAMPADGFVHRRATVG